MGAYTLVQTKEQAIKQHEHKLSIIESGKAFRDKFTIVRDLRTELQNNSLHAWFFLCADVCQAHGLDWQTILEKAISREVTADSFKDIAWKPVQKAITGHISTAKCDTKQYNEIYNVLCRAFAKNYAVSLPEWPKFK